MDKIFNLFSLTHKSTTLVNSTGVEVKVLALLFFLLFFMALRYLDTFDGCWIVYIALSRSKLCPRAIRTSYPPLYFTRYYSPSNLQFSLKAHAWREIAFPTPQPGNFSFRTAFAKTGSVDDVATPHGAHM